MSIRKKLKNGDTKMYETQMIPLFPLNIVLLPQTPIPLHIFEERYKEMINLCLETKSEFGIVLASASKVQKYGCTAQIEKIIQEYDDGRLVIQIKGVNRFRILRISEEKSYLEAEVELFDDTDSHENLVQLAETGLTQIRKLQKITKTEQFIEDMEQMDYKTLSFYLSAAYGFTAEEKQHFLEMKSTAQRLEETVKGLKIVVKRIRMLKAIEKSNMINKKKYGFSTN
jgi:Lon protease-like protein